MLKIAEISIFDAPKGATMVNPVNTDLVMGKGLALEFKMRFPEHEKFYKSFFTNKEAGDILLDADRNILMAATKGSWRKKSDIKTIEKICKSILKMFEENKLTYVYVPMLGCGYGGLHFEKDVLPIFKKHFSDIPNKVVIVKGVHDTKRDEDFMKFARESSVNILTDALKNREDALIIKAAVSDNSTKLFRDILKFEGISKKLYKKIIKIKFKLGGQIELSSL